MVPTAPVFPPIDGTTELIAEDLDPRQTSPTEPHPRAGKVMDKW